MFSFNKHYCSNGHLMTKPVITHQSLTQTYRRLIETKKIRHDVCQEKIIVNLQNVSNALTEASCVPIKKSMTHWFNSLRYLGNQRPKNRIKGIYLWGGVGTGKTLLMDLFYNDLPIKNKLRVNYHDFMETVQQRINQYKGQSNPLIQVANDYAQYHVICLDEMHVTHISDAMILVNLMDQLFSDGVVLIITSNRHPDLLYKHGLQRSRFLPVIELIKQHNQVLSLNMSVDYRLSKKLQEKSLYLDANHFQTQSILQAHFNRLSTSNQTAVIRKNTRIKINNRFIETVDVSKHVVWFTFNSLCDTARSIDDYEVIADRYLTVILQDIPLIDNARLESGRRFVNLIYILYEASVKLIFSAVAAPENLYVGGIGLRHPFLRTVSRLTEMQSADYNAL